MLRAYWPARVCTLCCTHKPNNLCLPVRIKWCTLVRLCMRCICAAVVSMLPLCQLTNICADARKIVGHMDANGDGPHCRHMHIHTNYTCMYVYLCALCSLQRMRMPPLLAPPLNHLESCKSCATHCQHIGVCGACNSHFYTLQHARTI